MAKCDAYVVCMDKHLLIYASYDVAVRYKRQMDRSTLLCAFAGTAILTANFFTDISPIPFYLFAGIFLLFGAISCWSRNSMLNDVQNGLLVFRFTPEGWHRNEQSVLYRWEDFKRVEFAERAITFYEAKQHKIHSSTISPMLMTDSEFDKVDSWIRTHIPAHMQP